MPCVPKGNPLAVSIDVRLPSGATRKASTLRNPVEVGCSVAIKPMTTRTSNTMKLFLRIMLPSLARKFWMSSIVSVHDASGGVGEWLRGDELLKVSYGVTIARVSDLSDLAAWKRPASRSVAKTNRRLRATTQADKSRSL